LTWESFPFQANLGAQEYILGRRAVEEMIHSAGSSVLLGAFWIVFLIVSHASPGAIELVLTLFFAWVIEALVRPFWTKRGAQKPENDVAVKTRKLGRTQR
jgi:hypothetical protein